MSTCTFYSLCLLSSEQHNLAKGLVFFPNVTEPRNIVPLNISQH